MIVEEQLRIFLSMLAAGVFVGFCVTFYERFITRGKKGVWRFFPDLLFWLGQALIVFLLLFQLNGAELRFYMLIALFAGFILYWKLARQLILHVFNWLSWLIITILTILFLPFKWIWFVIMLFLTVILRLLTFIARPFHPISQFLQKKGSILAKKIKIWVNLLYNRG